MNLRKAAQQATPREHLLKELMDSRVPKTEREHAAVREIERLRAALSGPLKFAGIEIKEIRLPENTSMRLDGDVLVIERAHGIGGEE